MVAAEIVRTGQDEEHGEQDEEVQGREEGPEAAGHGGEVERRNPVDDGDQIGQ